MMCLPTPALSIRRRSAVRSFRIALTAATLSVAGILTTGCTNQTEAPKPKERFTKLPDAVNLPDFMEGTIYEKTELINTQPYNVSSYGLVGQLRGTGDSTASNVVRQYMVKEIARRGFGDALLPGFEKITPGDVLSNPNYAIVRVDAFIPPGARRDDFIDAQVTCLAGNKTTSLGNGTLFETDLKEGGADVDNPSGAVNTFVRVKGPVVVNTAYALQNPGDLSPQARASLRQGTIMFNARVIKDRPLMLQLRQPQSTMSRSIEALVDYRFQNDEVAKAQNEGIVDLYVPHSFRGDWAHFAEVVRHMYVRNDADFNIRKSRQLAEAATLPGARLEDISYCFEGIGSHALPALRPLLNHPDQAVAYYAARAAAFIRDDTGAAEQRLIQMARASGHPFQITAIRTLGALPKSHSLNSMLRELLVSPEAQVRIEAYLILARNNDSAIMSTPVAPLRTPNNQKFLLDRVPCDAPPLIYVTRTGKPRIALMGRIPDLDLPVPFTTMDNRLTLATRQRGRVTIFFRDPMRPAPVAVESQQDLDMVIARLGGMGAEDETLNFSYSEVAAILQTLADTSRLTARKSNGELIRTAFLMQEPQRVRDDLQNAGLIASGGLPGETPQFGPPAEVGPGVSVPGTDPNKGGGTTSPGGSTGTVGSTGTGSNGTSGTNAGSSTGVKPVGPPQPLTTGGTPQVGARDPGPQPVPAPQQPAAPAAGQSNAPKF
ncbi:flagellar basal body P-ring protein FlgI [Humisphaera borealis]|uniref:Flagellar basal body P-ring protein FlgI n=1 Tax=Humisphaera borealis TaxID=2807512 RepID=A0A7M2WYL3_9BACT|nr:flagellar basal body P-ring protein FlgI [Humisphaera borealis]QOV90607.1 flagellar basal body P-ring protein FlgI [Humisphaera borealis]